MCTTSPVFNISLHKFRNIGGKMDHIALPNQRILVPGCRWVSVERSQLMVEILVQEDTYSEKVPQLCKMRRRKERDR
jgi:hypothetical protein